MFVAPFRKSYAHYHTRVIRTKDQRLSWFFGCLNTLLNPKNWELSINLGRAGDPSKKPFSVSGSESLAQHAADFGPRQTVCSLFPAHPPDKRFFNPVTRTKSASISCSQWRDKLAQ